MTKNNKKIIFLQCKDFAIDLLKKNKIKAIVLGAFVLTAFLTGIIVAVKTKSDYGTASGLGIIDSRGGLTSSFFTRIFSALFVFLILFGCSFRSYLLPVAAILLCYRSYLLGLNVTLIIVLYGLSGALVSILVALPCQLLMLAILYLFYILMCQTNKECKCFGQSKTSFQKMKIFLLAILLIFVLCLIESVLLTLFSAKIILVI
jgi:hypothetical protein